MTDTMYRGFFGDSERAFRLAPAQVAELERLTGAGIGVIFNRVAGRMFMQADIVEIIRLGLIGAGMAPQPASDLVNLYVVGRPYAESYPLAVEIITRLWFGVHADDQAAPESGAAS